MTGWRIGWAIGAPAVVKFMGDIQSQETSNSCSVSQYAALEAVTGTQDSVKAMISEFAKRREYVLSRIQRMPHVTCIPPGGTFYTWINISRHFGRILGGHTISDSTDFCRAALTSAHVAMVMGSAFGMEGYIRLSFASDFRTLERAFDALDRFLAG
jgi:aspartate aminotransferase